MLTLYEREKMETDKLSALTEISKQLKLLNYLKLWEMSVKLNLSKDDLDDITTEMYNKLD